MPSFHNLEKILYNYNDSIKSVLKGFNKTVGITENKGFGLVLDDSRKCIGVISDGDIRNKIVSDISMDEPVKKVMNSNFIFVRSTDNYHKILRQFDKKIVNLPVLDHDDRPVDLYQYSKFVASTRSKLRIIRARVPVRISFCGGGTDMSNYINQSTSAVLSVTINKYCTASVIVRNDDEIHITSKDLNLKYSAKNLNDIEFGDNLDLIKAAIKIMQPNYGFDLEIFAEFEPGTGLGGSSAVVVSVLGALNYFRNEEQLDIYQLADVAYQVERIDMKIYGGWQDQYATVFGGFSWIEFRQNEVIVNPIMLQKETSLELEYNLMLFRIGGQRNSSDIQETYIHKIDNNANELDSFAEMIELAIQMKEALLKGEVKTFGDLLHDSWVLKRKMNKNSTNDFIEDSYKTARDLGALGGKLLGAGGSGYLLIYASPLYQKQIKDVLAEKGVIQEMFNFSRKGLEVWSTIK